ncbi:PsbP domain-containing protein 2- chloroplastic [Striga hermonthica]|uniref:PsbP domain-containing protein 2- chloroplastic n=1 Tax=Striga hermonthica TaxID=68872 RepID=A0A9N7NL83_STRHE|nr:PsbP domain-containing protein 2- chloroplastic [Striga hermonthica]
MPLRGISVSSATHPHSNFPILQNPATITSSLAPKIPDNVQWREKSPPFSSGRRMLNLSIVGFLLSFGQPFPRFLFFSKAMAELDRYTDAKQGFTVLVPSSWVKVDKAGATLLFEEANKRANSVGVVVSPTRISSLGEFGTTQFVADKLIQAERRKESTKEAEVISVAERQGQGGLQVFEFEYKVDSTRGGPKRVFSAAFVKSKRLYLLNITHSDGLDNPLSVETKMMLEQVMHSFDATPST